MPLTRSANQVKFPKKLHGILSNPQFHHIISWMPHGRSWRVSDKDAFNKVVCKQYLRIKYETFMKNINSWGFRRIKKKGNDFGSYYHPCFQRDCPNEVAHMWRLKVGRGRGSCNANNPIHAYPPVTPTLSGPDIFPVWSVAASSQLMTLGVLNPHPMSMPIYMPPPLPHHPPPHAGYWGPTLPTHASLVIHPLPLPQAPLGYANTVILGHQQHQDNMNGDSSQG
mmetsp:Transcript_28537/g.57226  ORF Transcript_28537/g.57226 Transcript_28537/m.57226 type:complete len:224 (+) Transcript_28537:113-784(+)